MLLIQIPPDHNTIILEMNFGLTMFALAVVILRAFTRVRIVKRIGWEDYFAILATVVNPSLNSSVSAKRY